MQTPTGRIRQKAWQILSASKAPLYSVVVKLELKNLRAKLFEPNNDRNGSGRYLLDNSFFGFRHLLLKVGLQRFGKRIDKWLLQHA